MADVHDATPRTPRTAADDLEHARSTCRSRHAALPAPGRRIARNQSRAATDAEGARRGSVATSYSSTTRLRPHPQYEAVIHNACGWIRRIPPVARPRHGAFGPTSPSSIDLFRCAPRSTHRRQSDGRTPRTSRQRGHPLDGAPHQGVAGVASSSHWCTSIIVIPARAPPCTARGEVSRCGGMRTRRRGRPGLPEPPPRWNC